MVAPSRREGPERGAAAPSSRGMSARVIRIDRTRCDGRGYCAELLPEMIRLDDWGFPIVRPGPVPVRVLEHARRAVDTCPLLAIRLAEVEGQ